jgi:kynureninase
VIQAADLYQHPNALAPDYSEFQVGERLLLTGHSHQAWPDRGFDGQARAWRDAAKHVDQKWELAFAAAERVRQGYATLLDDASERIALGANTHELLVRFLSGLALRERPRIVTTDGEFHTLRRQLDRLAEEGIEIVKVSSASPDKIPERLIEAIDDRTAAVFVSCVLYENARIVSGIGDVLTAAQRVGAELVVDSYHALNVVPFRLTEEGLNGAYVVGGGYKYCQLGEGNAFLRFPAECAMRPIVTGWYSEFSALSEGSAQTVVYGAGPDRFAGATYDPTSHYRAAAVFDFFEERRLAPELLREVSQHQVGLLAGAFDKLDLGPELMTRDRSASLDETGGFLALETPFANDVWRSLLARGVHTDYRGTTLRLGPAPYLSDHQLVMAMDALADVAFELRG